MSHANTAASLSPPHHRFLHLTPNIVTPQLAGSQMAGNWNVSAPAGVSVYLAALGKPKTFPGWSDIKITRWNHLTRQAIIQRLNWVFRASQYLRTCDSSHMLVKAAGWGCLFLCPNLSTHWFKAYWTRRHPVALMRSSWACSCYLMILPVCEDYWLPAWCQPAAACEEHNFLGASSIPLAFN